MAVVPRYRGMPWLFTLFIFTIVWVGLRKRDVCELVVVMYIYLAVVLGISTGVGDYWGLLKMLTGFLFFWALVLGWAITGDSSRC